MTEFVERHKRWLEESPGWSEDDQAVFSGMCFDGMDLRGAVLRNSCFVNCTFKNALLADADLSGAIFTVCDFTDTDLRFAKFNGTNCSSSRFPGAVLFGTDFANTTLTGADFHGAAIERTSFYSAVTGGAIFDSNVDLSASNVREDTDMTPKGEFVAWKAVSKRRILQLIIPEDAFRINLDCYRCKASKAYVEHIEDLEGNILPDKTASSIWDSSYVYHVGQIALPKGDFAEDAYTSAGIYFFVDRKNAVGYCH